MIVQHQWSQLACTRISWGVCYKADPRPRPRESDSGPGICILKSPLGDSDVSGLQPILEGTLAPKTHESDVPPFLVSHDQIRHWLCLQPDPHACRPSLDSNCSYFPPCFLKCVAAAWPSRASSSRTRSTSAPRTTSSSMAPAATAAGTSSLARSSPPWAAPTIPSASCAACAGERVAGGGRILC